MKIRFLPWVAALAAVVVLSASVLYPSGAPAAKTGSPGDGANCTECHGGTATTTAGLITSNIPSGGYVPGTTYQITASNPLTGAGKFGFEVSPQNAAGTLLGSLIAGSGSQLVGSGKYVTHVSANTTTSAWTFSWVAPSAGAGDVTFYGAFARGKPGPVTKSTLTVKEVSGLPSAAGPISGPSGVCKQGTESYSTTAIAGATSYLWSVPSGATIIGGQGTTSVNVTFGTSASSGIITVSGSNGVGNGAPSQLSVTVNDVPEAPATPSGPSLVNLQNTSSSNFTTTGVAVSYVWQISPSNAGTITGSTATAQVTWNLAFQGNAEIKVKGVNPCGDGALSIAKTVTLVNTTGVEDIAAGIRVYGQPGGYIRFEMNTNLDQANIKVLDLSGRLITNTVIAGRGTQQLNQNLNTGIYLIVIEAGKSIVKKKIFVN